MHSMNKTVHQRVIFFVHEQPRKQFLWNKVFISNTTSLSSTVHALSKMYPWRTFFLSYTERSILFIKWHFFPVHQQQLNIVHEQVKKTTSPTKPLVKCFFYPLLNVFFWPSMNGCSWTRFLGPPLTKSLQYRSSNTIFFLFINSNIASFMSK